MAGVPNGFEHRGDPDAAQDIQRGRARFAVDASGATAVEYTLLVGLIGLAVVGAMRAYSDKMVIVYNTLATAITTP